MVFLVCGFLLAGCEQEKVAVPTLEQPAPQVKPSVEQQVKESAGEVVEVGTQLLTETEVAEVAEVAEVQLSQTLVIENDRGAVTLTHADHAERYGCQGCHGDGTPGAFELGKDTAHSMCKGCHRKQNGPVPCNGCHNK